MIDVIFIYCIVKRDLHNGKIFKRPNRDYEEGVWNSE